MTQFTAYQKKQLGLFAMLTLAFPQPVYRFIRPQSR